MSSVAAHGVSRIWTTSEIYDFTKEACLSTTVEKVHMRMLEPNRRNPEPYEKFRFNEIIHFVRDTSLNSGLRESQYFSQNEVAYLFLGNTGYRQALNECYPNDPQMVAYFNSLITKAEQGGRIVAGAAMLVALRGSWVALAKLGKLGRAIGYALTATQLFGVSSLLYKMNATAERIDENCDQTCLKKEMLRNMQEKVEPVEALDESKQQIQSLLVKETENNLKNLKLQFAQAKSADDRARIHGIIQNREAFLRKYNGMQIP